MNISRYVLLILVSCFFRSATCFAQTDTIGLKGHQLITKYLKPGLNKYMVYYLQTASPKKIGFWYWEREIKNRQQDGLSVIEVTQHWYGADTSNYRYVRSVNELSGFAPLFHEEVIKGKIKAYKWSLHNIKGDNNTKGNSAAGFSLDFDKPNYNWNLDIETFEMLPLASGKTFAINFYDAGLDPPKYVIYKVAGSEIITAYGKSTDCWKLYTDGKLLDGKTYTETYWISKKGHEFLKEVDEYNGGYRYKIKLPDTAPDVASIYFQN